MSLSAVHEVLLTPPSVDDEVVDGSRLNVGDFRAAVEGMQLPQPCVLDDVDDRTLLTDGLLLLAVNEVQSRPGTLPT